MTINTKSNQLKIDLKIYDPNESDSRKGMHVKLKNADLKSNELTLREILIKYFG